MSIITALKARRDAMRDREAGFTLIELLVVVIIIGILAAIAIPVYLGVQNNAKESATKSDLTNDKVAVAAYSVDHNGAAMASADFTAANLTKYGYSKSDNTTAVTFSAAGSTNVGAWCILGTSVTTNTFHITSAGPVASGACPTDVTTW